MSINGYPLPNLMLLSLFFVLMRFDRKLMMKGGWFFYLNKMAALAAIFGSFILARDIFFSWVAVAFLIPYSVVVYFILKKSA